MERQRKEKDLQIKEKDQEITRIFEDKKSGDGIGA